MGCNFSAIALPLEVKTPEEITKYYKEIREALDGEYTGTLGSDNGSVIIHEEINLTLPGFQVPDRGSPLWDLDSTPEEEKIMDAIEQTEATKWGPTIALKINGEWFLAGFYPE